MNKKMDFMAVVKSAKSGNNLIKKGGEARESSAWKKLRESKTMAVINSTMRSGKVGGGGFMSYFNEQKQALGKATVGSLFFELPPPPPDGAKTFVMKFAKISHHGDDLGLCLDDGERQKSMCKMIC